MNGSDNVQLTMEDDKHDKDDSNKWVYEYPDACTIEATPQPMVDQSGAGTTPDTMADQSGAATARLRRTDSADVDAEFLCSCCYELMVEPTTLVCGHNFCRLCLATWSLTSKKKECPTCRQDWQGHPKVNITLRSMMRKMLGNKMEVREQEVMGNADNNLKVEEFDKKMAAAPQQRKVDAGAFCTGICITLGVILVAYLVWFWRNSDEDLLIHKPVVRWRSEDVVTWLTHMGWAEEYTHVVTQEGIDGPMLLSLDEDNLGSLLNVSNPLHRRALLIAIEDVREKGVKMPSTLWEYKALYPGRCLFLLYGLKDFPRTTLLYLYLFNYEDIFLPFLHFTTPASDQELPYTWTRVPSPTVGQWVVFLTNAVLLPYWLIAKLTWSMFNGQFWTSLFILCSCAVLSLMEVSMLKKYFLQAQWRSTMASLKSYSKMLLTLFIAMIVWPVVPRLICDFLFYANLYFTPMQQAKSLFNSWRHNVL